MSEFPRVAYLLKQYPRLSETFILNEILGLEEMGGDVTIFSLRHATEGRFHPGVAAVRGSVHYLPRADKQSFLDALRTVPDVESADLRAAIAFSDRLPADRRAETLLQAVHLAAAVRRLEINHLHAHFLTIAAQAAHLAHLLTGVSYTVTAHAKDIYRHSVDWDLAAQVAGAATAVVTVCDANLRYLAHRLDGSGARIVRIYNGLGPQDPRTPLDERQRGLVLGVGRLVEKKGFDVLLDAVAELARQRPDVSCVIVGDGEDRERLQRHADRLGLGTRVHFTGALPQDQVARWLRRAHVLAAPCLIGEDGNQDALPTVLLEALGAGLPVVSTPVAGIPEIVDHGVHGLLVACGDPVAVAASIAEIIDDDVRWTAMSTAGPDRLAERFDRSNTIRDLVETMDAAETLA
jgi:colanic acid/amylovoran biosynthesis glycosyltransferase